MAPIVFDELTKHYDDVVGVDDLSLQVEHGEIFGFLGPNGAGKTTAIRTLLGLLHATGGDAHLLGASIRDESALTAARRNVGYIPASLAFEEDRTGAEVLDFFGTVRGDSRRDELLQTFTPPLERRIREYSTGNKQMLAIVQAFMHGPELVIMDEPTSGLDPLKQEEFYQFLDAERADGTTIFFSSHVLSEVRRVCDRAGLLRDGSLVALETIDDLITQGEKRVQVRFEQDSPPPDLNLNGISNVRTVGNDTQFDYQGEPRTLLNVLANLPVADVSIKEPPLEEVFMQYYDPAPEATDA